MVRMPHWPVPMERQSTKLGLERIAELLKYLGNPQSNTPPIIHVAGKCAKSRSNCSSTARKLTIWSWSSWRGRYGI